MLKKQTRNYIKNSCQTQLFSAVCVTEILSQEIKTKSFPPTIEKLFISHGKTLKKNRKKLIPNNIAPPLFAPVASSYEFLQFLAI
jgi:hypothetical protein